MGKKPIVHLRVYKGSDLNYDAAGKVKNENQLVKLTHDTVEYSNFLKHLHSNGYGKVEVEKVLDGDKLELVEDTKAIKEEVKVAFQGEEKERVLTPDQKRIADLEAKLEALLSGQKQDKKESASEDEEDLKEARDEYQKAFGKKGHHSWSAEEIRQKIKEK